MEGEGSAETHFGVQVYLPEYCLQGEELPAHVLWDRSRKATVAVSYPQSLKIVAIFNATPGGIDTTGENEFIVRDCETNGYLGLLFSAGPISRPREEVVVRFRIREEGADTWVDEERRSVLFRPLLSVIEVPDTVSVEVERKTETLGIDHRIAIQNVGDGTAVVRVKIASSSGIAKTMPSQIDEFRRRFWTDMEAALEDVQKEYPELSEILEDFIRLAKEPLSFTPEALTEAKEFVARLDAAFSENEQALLAFASAIVTAWLKNLQLITELGSFLGYLNSIGEGRVLLADSMEVLRVAKPGGSLVITLETTDLAYNEYRPIPLAPIEIRCDRDCEIPIHMLFDWRPRQKEVG